MDKDNQKDEIWLDGYDLQRLIELYTKYEPIKETTEEQYRSYFEYSNDKYENFRILGKHINSIKELLVSNYGNIKYNGIIIPSTLVSNGPNKGVYLGKIDHYREILFPDLPVKRYVFKTYRLVAEVWCNNPDPERYTIVHHIGNDSCDNKNNLLFLTNNQHLSIHNKKKLLNLEKDIETSSDIINCYTEEEYLKIFEEFLDSHPLDIKHKN
jgi:hypothetical protein